MNRLRVWWFWNSWRFSPAIRLYQLRITVLQSWDRLVCVFKGHVEKLVWEDDPEGSTFCQRCGAYWYGGREWAETRIYFVPKGKGE